MVAKMTILPKAIYRANAIPTKFLPQLFRDLKRISQIHRKKNRIAKTFHTVKEIMEISLSMISHWITELKYLKRHGRSIKNDMLINAIRMRCRHNPTHL